MTRAILNVGAEFTYRVTYSFGKSVGGSGLFEDEKAALAEVNPLCWTVLPLLQ